MERESFRERESGFLGREGSRSASNGRASRKDFREGLFSIFVDNLNPIVDQGSLWDIFNTFGLVRDVFVSSKNSLRRSGFAFIRFASMAEASKVARLTDGMHICGWPIVSKVATFGWNNRRTLVSKDDSLKGGFATKSFGGQFCSDNRRERGCSFVEVVKGDKHRKVPSIKEDNVETKEMFWDGSKSEADWLSKCAVGVLKGFNNVSSVNYRLINKGFSFSSLYLGDKFILWKFESEDDCLGFINNRYFWNDCFSLMEKWSFSSIARARPVWINVSGVPLSCWNSEFFMELGRLIGDPLTIHEETLLRKRLDIGRLLVLIPFGFCCPSKIKVVDGYKSFILSVVEDTTPVSCSWVEEFLGLKKDYLVFSSNGRNTDIGEHEASKFKIQKSSKFKIQNSSDKVGKMSNWQPVAEDTEENKQIGGFDIVGEIKKHSLEGLNLFVDLGSVGLVEGRRAIGLDPNLTSLVSSEDGLVDSNGIEPTFKACSCPNDGGAGVENPGMEDMSRRENADEEKEDFLGNSNHFEDVGDKLSKVSPENCIIDYGMAPKVKVVSSNFSDDNAKLEFAERKDSELVPVSVIKRRGRKCYLPIKSHAKKTRNSKSRMSPQNSSDRAVGIKEM